MSTIGFNHYNLRAPRELMDKLKAFYCEIVGLTEGQRPPFESFGYWLYAGDQCVLHLSQAKPDEVRLTHVTTTLDHVAFTCTNRAEVEARLKQHNIGFKTGRVPTLGIAQLFFKDPAGNGLELSFSDAPV
ncbi:VOC family protein [Nitrosovibrio sp. Nv4]|uniref:VOC family protein n=1 Tax=Nitrosovibrio sp. Nv4 TaxID=1945880 RepID=UPI000BCB4308|nr:VOC family protein [Nitrosovibrio sp. Nv4]SOD41635.1 Glyoxalase/Bleomycin resistance protein/Dioxygenase superfamily protein [Nitrosovibrio sp. Nv4]